jgi:cobalt/nickel transport system permease protein
MHIPDGILATPVWAGLDAVSLPAVAWIARRAERRVDQSRIPLLGVMGAFVFAAQMINFPVGAGTSGHLMGAALLAITLGPSAAAVVMTAVLAIQAFVFQDGGILALGANVFNMAVAGVAAGYLPYHFWGRGPRRRAAIFASGFLSVVTGALLALAELVLSGAPMPGSVLWLSLVLFALTGLIEGAITVAVTEGIEKLGPNMVRKSSGRSFRLAAVLGLAAVLLAVFGVMLASTSPDVLATTAERIGLAARARTLFEGPLADYQAHFGASPWLGRAAAGLAGLVLIYGVCLAASRVMSRQRSG